MSPPAATVLGAPAARLGAPERLAALEATGLLAPGDAGAGPTGARVLAPVPELERVARLAARALGTPLAQVNIVTAAAQVPVAAVATQEPEAPWRVAVGLDRSYCQHVVAGDRPVVIEDARTHPLVCGSLATVEAGIVGYVAVPLRAPGGEPVGSVCAVDMRVRQWTPADVAALEDVAAVAAEVIARRSAEARARALADAVPHVVWTSTPDGRTTSLNRRWYEYTGQPVPPAGAEFAAAYHNDFVEHGTYLHPDDVPGIASAWREHLPDGARPADQFTFEFRLRGGDGQYRWHLGRVVARRDADGRLVGWVGTGTDVHDARELEARFRAAQELAPTGFMLLRARRDAAGALEDFEYTFINPAGARLTGRTPEEVVGRSFTEVFPSVRGAGLWDAYARVLETGEPYEQELAYPYDGVVATAYHLTAVRVGDGLAVSFADVSERARALVEAEGARAAAESANAAKAQFLASMSHELRTPLNAIGGYAQLLDMGLHGPVTDDQRSALARVTRAQQHLLGLINDILNYAKLESGRVEYNLEHVDMRDVVGDVAPLLEPQVAARGLAFRVDLPASAHAVWADREKLRQILLNLLGNAVKFTDAGGRVSVDVGARGDGTGPGDLVFVRVRDTGVGIPRDKQDAIFEPFVQVRANKGRLHEGTGLGLAISRDLARGMGGDLRVRSALGRGSVFTLALRRVTAGNGAPVDRRRPDARRSAEERRSDPNRRAGDDRRDG